MASPVALPARPPLRLVQVAAVVREHGVQEVRVGVGGLLGEGSGDLLLLALPGDQERPVVLGLSPRALYDAVERVLR